MKQVFDIRNKENKTLATFETLEQALESLKAQGFGICTSFLHCSFYKNGEDGTAFWLGDNLGVARDIVRRTI